MWLGELPSFLSIDAPVEYFRRLFDSMLMQDIVEQSNFYPIQESLAKPLRLTCNSFFAVIMMMSIFALPSSRLY